MLFIFFSPSGSRNAMPYIPIYIHVEYESARSFPFYSSIAAAAALLLLLFFFSYSLRVEPDSPANFRPPKSLRHPPLYMAHPLRLVLPFIFSLTFPLEQQRFPFFLNPSLLPSLGCCCCCWTGFIPTQSIERSPGACEFLLCLLLLLLLLRSKLRVSPISLPRPRFSTPNRTL